MNEGEQRYYSGTLDDMLDALHKSWDRNQEIIEGKILAIDESLERIDGHVKGIRNRLANETKDLFEAVREALKVKEDMEELLSGLEAETLEKIKQIATVLDYK